MSGGAWQGLKCLSRACSDVGARIPPPGGRGTHGRWVEAALGDRWQLSLCHHFCCPGCPALHWNVAPQVVGEAVATPGVPEGQRCRVMGVPSLCPRPVAATQPAQRSDARLLRGWGSHGPALRD